MRGEEKRKRRVNNLRVLQRTHTFRQIADAAGVNEAYLSQIATEVVGKGRKSPRSLSDAYAEKIETGLNLPAGWMDEPHEDVQVVEGTMRVNIGPPNMNANIHANVHPGPETRGLVPLISWVQAGEWHEADDHLLPGQGEGWYPCLRSHGLNTYALRVEGDSMTAPHGKSYPPRCIIYVDPDQAGGVVSGDRVIAKIVGDDHKVTFKTFVEDAGQRFLKPLNPQYPLIRDEFRIIGKVIGKWEDE